MNHSPNVAPEHHHAIEVENEGLYVHLGRRRVRLEYLLLGVMLVVAATLAALLFALRLGPDDLERWGYAGLFAIALLRSASVVIPMPAGGIVFAAGGLLDGAWGIPTPVLVGLTAGFAESLGEFTGYGAGLGGSRMLQKRRLYQRVKGWVERRSVLTIFVMSFTPSPVFDVAGLAAGAVRMPILKFYPAMLAGKILRGMLVATAGFYGIGLIESLF
ncbi:MAG: VTT domain-containing protein [Dehalococcoidia bacterium]|nr:VTT domain-containing protein [Dehalococcoidia bacterium]